MMQVFTVAESQKLGWTKVNTACFLGLTICAGLVVFFCADCDDL